MKVRGGRCPGARFVGRAVHAAARYHVVEARRAVWALVGALVACCSALPADVAEADTFTATYTELARSPANYAASWFSGAVTRDGRFIYGLGHSHNSHGNNGLWVFDRATQTHQSVSPNTSWLWKWETDANKHDVPKSGHWATLDPVADKALYDYFGGPNIVALTNRNNHEAFYMPGVDQFWVLGGTTFYQSSPYFGGRFDLKTKRWAYLSKPWSDPTKKDDLADFSAGLIAGQHPGWTSPNAAAAVCMDTDTAFLVGGMNDPTGIVRLIEPNPAGPEHYRWATAPTPARLAVENARANAACVGDTVYLIGGDMRMADGSNTRPAVAPFWKFHVPTRTWTALPTGPAGAYFTVMTYDKVANALLVYGGTGPNGQHRLWVYDLAAQQWQDLTGTVPNLPKADMHTGGYLPGYGHVYKGGRRFNADGSEMDYTASGMFMRIVLHRVPGRGSPVAVPPQAEPVTPPPVPPPPVAVADRDQSIVARVKNRQRLGDEAATVTPRAAVERSPGDGGAVTAPGQSILERVKGRAQSGQAAVAPHESGTTPAGVAPGQVPTTSDIKITWVRGQLWGLPNRPSNATKHMRMAEGPGGRVYMMGGDWGSGSVGAENSGRQEVYSFHPDNPTDSWRLDAPYCGTTANPVHWHTDEAGAVWDAKRGLIWKLAGTEYSTMVNDPCETSGGSVKAKVITFNPTTNLWKVPAGFDQTRFGYVANGVIDPDKDEIVQIIDRAAKHLSLQTGQWATYPLPKGPMRFNAITARLGRNVWWCNRAQVIESYNLDTHTLTSYSVAPWPVPTEGWEMQMVFPVGDKLLVIRPTSGPATPRHAALFDPATTTWTPIDQGDGWGNSGFMHSSGRVIFMGGGINGPEESNKQVWVGTLKPLVRPLQ